MSKTLLLITLLSLNQQLSVKAVAQLQFKLHTAQMVSVITNLMFCHHIALRLWILMFPYQLVILTSALITLH